MFNDNNKNISQSLKQETERSTETFKILKDMTTAIDKKQKKSSQESAAGREIYGQLSVQLK
jgi:flagellar hook-basal body complex protein FliE